jgi:hypothetical protein
MSNNFPTYLKSNNTGDVGVNIVSKIVNDDMQFIFKRNHAEYDFGIDAYIEVVTDSGAVTGQLIGVQIKCGKSHFKTKTKTGYTFYGENKHLNYYCNAPFPVIIVICEPDSRECYWQSFTIQSTEETRTSWKINIPKRNKLLASSKTQLLELVGSAIDFTNKAKEEWELVKQLKGAEVVHYSVPRIDIESGNVKPLKDYIDRILKNDQLAISLQGKVVVSVDGYQFDKRELWEIRDVRRWVKKAEPKIKYWFFFCSHNDRTETLTFILACLTNVKTISQNQDGRQELHLEYESKPLKPVLERNFLYQNILTDRYSMSREESKRITAESMHSLGRKN